MSSDNVNQAGGGESSGGGGAASSPTEEDLDSDVGTIFSDEEEGERCKELSEDDDDDCVDGGQVSDEDSASSGSSDSDDGSEKCPICLQRFTEQEIGTPEMCEHQFCLRCITAWSKKVATCPIDRKFFSTILVKKQWDGEVIRIEDVRTQNTQSNEGEYDSNPTYCEVCGRCDREERLLLCDGCDLAYHLECLDPPLEYVPIEDWFCPSCVLQGVNVDDDEPEVVAVAESSRPPIPVRIPRTLQNERILQSIDVPSAPIQDVINAVIQGINANSLAPRPKTRTRRTTTKTRRSRKSTAKKRKSATSRSSGGGGGGRKRRSKRKTRRRRRVAVDKRPNTARGRIAHHLGIMPPLPGQIYVGLPPACRSAGSSSHSKSSASTSTSNITSLRYSAGITPLRMFGAANDLSELIDCYSDEEGPVTSVARVPALQRTLGATLKGPPNIVHTLNSSSASSSSQPISYDVLGSILKKQNILFNDKNIKISRDGTLVPSINSSTLPGLPNNKQQKPSTNSNSVTPSTSPSSSPEKSGSSSANRIQSRVAVCGLNSTQQQENQNSNQLNYSNTSGNGGKSSRTTESGGGGGEHENNGSRMGSGSPSSSNSNANDSIDSPTEYWGTQSSQVPADDDDVDIYSDIEEQTQEAEKTDSSGAVVTASVSRRNSKDVNRADGDVDNTNPSNSSGEKVSPDDGSSPHQPEDIQDSDLDDMVIDEDSEQKQSPRKDSGTNETASTSRRTSIESKKSVEQNIPEKVPVENLPDSPESIPLPDSPPPDISDVDDKDIIEEKVVKKKSSEGESSKKIALSGGVKPKVYDPSEPLDSSDEDENSERNLAKNRKKKSPVYPPLKRKQLANAVGQSLAVFSAGRRKLQTTSVSRKPQTSSSAGRMDLSTIPIPAEEVRRPVIHFSIPKRHNLIPISSLMKRQKGVARKESKGDGSSNSFQSEISKAFGNESQEENSAADDGDENLPKISLVAEIFGSDEDEEEEVAQAAVVDESATQASIPVGVVEGQIEDQPETAENIAKSANTETAIDVTSGRWKTVSEEVPSSLQNSSAEGVANVNGDGGKAENETSGGVRNPEAEEEPEIIEIVTLNPPTRPPRPPSRRFMLPHEVETISDSSNSDIEVIDEVSTPRTTKKKDNDGGGGSRSRSRSPRSNRREKKRRHSASSEKSNSDDGELGDKDGVNAKRRRKEKRRKDRHKRRRTSTERAVDAALHSNVSSADEEGDNVTWKKPSKKGNDRNYRLGKSKSSRAGSGDRTPNRSISPRLRGRRGRNSSVSPNRRMSSPARRRSNSRYSDKSPSRSRAAWSRNRRSRSGSSGHSYNSFRSSARRHPLHRSSVSPHHGYSRSPSRSPVPIRFRSSQMSANRRSRSVSEGGSRERSGQRRRMVARRTHSRSRSISPISRNKKRSSKYSSKSSPIDSLKRKKSKLIKKAGKSALLKAKRKDKEQRLKEKGEKRKLSKLKSGGEEDKLSTGKSKLTKDKLEKKRRKREKSLSPVKAIVADGDSIVVSLSFQKDTTSHGNLTSEKNSSGKLSSKKHRESKQQRSSSKLKESSTKSSKSPSVKQGLMDLGAEDLSSNSESSSATSNNKISRDKEIGASKVSSSGDGSAGDNYTLGGSGNLDESCEVQGDSLVTSTRDSLEPSAVTEEEYPNSGTSPVNSKTVSLESANKLTIQNVSSTAHSPRVQVANSNNPPSAINLQGASSQQNSQHGSATAQKSSSTASSVGLDLLSSQTGAAAAAAAAMSVSMSQSSQQLRYPPASGNMINPVLATVASALFAVRQQAPGPHTNMTGGTGMSGMMRAARNKGRSSYGGGGDTSPMSPNSSDGDDLFEPPTDHQKKGGSSGGHQGKGASGNPGNISNIFDTLFGSEPQQSKQPSRQDGKPSKPKPQNRQPSRSKVQKKESSGPAPCDININEDVPASAVELSVQEKLINKINRQERVVEEVKLCLKPHYIKKHVNKEEYKEILRRAVPKICHSKTGEINPFKIRELIDAYVRKFRHNRKKAP